MSVTRRAVLGALAAAVLVGCRPRRRPRPELSSADRGALDVAVDAERALLADYDAAIAQLDAVAAGPLTRARGRHAAHLRALTAARRPSPSPTTAPSPTVPSVGPIDRATLTAALSASFASLREASVSTPSGRIAALLGSVAAEHAADAGIRA